MESLADKENPQGILAVVHQKLTRLDDLELSADWRGGGLTAGPGKCRDDFAYAGCRRRGSALPARWRRGSISSDLRPCQHGDDFLEADCSNFVQGIYGLVAARRLSTDRHIGPCGTKLS